MVDKSALIGGIAGGILGVILIVVIIIAVFYCRRNFNRRTNKRAKFITSDGEVLTKKWPQDHIPVEERAEWDKSNPGLPKQMFFNEVNDEEEHVEVHEKRAIEQFERVAEAPPAAPAPVPLRPVTPPPPRHERYVVERPPIRGDVYRRHYYTATRTSRSSFYSSCSSVSSSRSVSTSAGLREEPQLVYHIYQPQPTSVNPQYVTWPTPTAVPPAAYMLQTPHYPPTPPTQPRIYRDRLQYIERPPAIEEQERALIITDEVPEPEPFRFPVPEPEPIRGPVPVIVSELLQSRVVTHQAPVVVDQGPMPVFVAPLQ